MADVQFSLQQCSVHCLHSGTGAAGDGQCCWCGYHFGFPANGVTVTGAQLHTLTAKGQLGPFFATIKAAGGKVNS